MCTVLLPPGDNPIAVNIYIISRWKGDHAGDVDTEFGNVSWKRERNRCGRAGKANDVRTLDPSSTNAERRSVYFASLKIV